MEEYLNWKSEQIYSSDYAFSYDEMTKRLEEYFNIKPKYIQEELDV